MRRHVLAALFVCLPALAFAQATPASTLAWDQPNATAAEAQAFTYTAYADGSATGTVLSGVTCSGSPVVCTVPFPAFTPGSHTIELTASNSAGTSPKSAPFPFTFVIVPSTPSGIRIQ